MSSEPHEGAPEQSSAVSVAREQAHDLMRTLLDVLLRVAPAAASKEEWLVEGGSRAGVALQRYCVSPTGYRQSFHWFQSLSYLNCCYSESREATNSV